ncbi:HSP90 family protein [Demequina capsici]|uniref:HSP90 family protein n=1 Tax=Demequina capsici TaxID=3075620 RepID=A0AA96J7Y7_9MICO|nr:HSP90 family protein [Demequina sp. OYTSA14]WNM24493.1 HSP90 family protein [Demequina sp. OYTSA14]
MAAPERFQVDLAGVVDLLGRSLYSSPRVYLRELIQNAADAIRARTEVEHGFQGTVAITPADVGEGMLVIQDDGIGLTSQEARELLSTVGRSSKRDLFDLPRTDRLGRFGVGLLSAFMIGDEVQVRSRSLGGAPPCLWVGRSDGTFTVRELDGPDAAAVAVGSMVSVRPRADAAVMAASASVRTSAARFASHLPEALLLADPSGRWVSINETPGFLGDEVARRLYGEELLGAVPLAAIPITVAATGTRGTAYVLPTPPPPGTAAPALCHLGGMLVGSRVTGLLPDWAFFAALALDSTGLNPTASREALVDDDALAVTREGIGTALREWIRQTAIADPARLRVFAAVHGLALRQLALSDPELAGVLLPALVVPTSHGERRLGDLLASGEPLRYTPTVDEFRQVAPLSAELVINAGHAYDEAIMRLVDRLGLARTEPVDVIAIVDALERPPEQDAESARSLARRAAATLVDREGVSVDVRVVPGGRMPAVFVQDSAMLRAADRRRARAEGDALWAQVLDAVDEAERRDGADHPTARLCLDWSNEAVRALARLEDDAVLARAIRLMLVTALLAGHHPVEGRDRQELTDAVSELVALSVGLSGFGVVRPEDFA